MLNVEVYIENQRLDLHDGEAISVVSSVQNIEDISRTFNDFSQSFTVPASNRNNSIFKHYYNASINNGFDARIRHDARIEINAVPFRVGSIRLEAVQIRNNRPEWYRITFFGQLIDLKELIGDDYLSALDLTEYDIEYNSDNVLIGIHTGYNSGDLVFPLISTKRQWFYDSNSATTTYSDTLANIAWNGSGSVHGMEWLSFRPALKVMPIIEAIEAKYGISFSRDFFSDISGPIADLYLWLANEDAEEAVKRYTRVADYENIIENVVAAGDFNNSNGSWTFYDTAVLPIVQNIDVSCDSSDGVQYTLQLMEGDTVLGEDTGTGFLQVVHSFSGTDPKVGTEYYARVITTADKTITDADFVINLTAGDLLDVDKDTFTVTSTTLRVSQFMPKIKAIDFLKGIINKYNLVVIPTSSTNFTIKTLDEWYNDGRIYDISKYVDTSESEVRRPEIYREISFSFEDPQTILASKFKDVNETGYGDLSTKLKAADGTNLDGEEFEIELPFEQMVYERLPDLNDDSLTNIVYGLSLDPGLGQVVPKAHLLYVITRSVSSNPLSFVDDSGAKSQINTTAFLPSHSDADAQNYSTTFGAEINEHTGAAMTNSLFSLYYSDYITDSFSIKRRMYNYTALLPIWLLNTLKLNDRLIINGDRYLINKMTTNATTGIVQFELLNDIYNITDNSTSTEEETGSSSTPQTPTTPTAATSFSISSTGASTRTGGCALSPNSSKYWDGSESYPTLADVIYNDSNKVTPFNGGNLYYKIANDLVIRITTLGVVTDVYDCVAMGSP